MQAPFAAQPEANDYSSDAEDNRDSFANFDPGQDCSAGNGQNSPVHLCEILFGVVFGATLLTEY
jgi:hypothetical protein